MKKIQFPIVILFLVSLIPLLDLFHPGLPITHDGQDHVARIANFYRNLEEGNLIPRWAGNLNWGYGHPILMFLYPLPSYLASLFHIFGFSLVDSTKIVFGLTYVLSGITMYIWIKAFIGEKAGVVAGLLYTFAPYRFVDLYVRGAIGEHVAFVLPPLILYFLLKLSKRYSYWFVVGGAFSLAGLMLSHNAISLMFLPLIFLYILYLLWQTNLKRYFIPTTLYLLLLAFGLSAFFWMPAFFEGKYTLRDIVTRGEYASRFVQFKDFLYGQWNYGGSGQFSIQIGIVHWIMTLLSIPAAIFFYKKGNRLWVLAAVCALIFSVTLFLMIAPSAFIWEKISLLQKFQFPWRLLSVTVFVTSVLGAITVSSIPKRTRHVAVAGIIASLLVANTNYWHVKGYLIKNEEFFTRIYRSTTDTGESSPRWSVRFMEKEPSAHLEVVEGVARIEELERKTAIHRYRISLDTKARLRENTLYFPGWETFVDGKKVSIEFQDPANRGLITFFVSKGDHIIEVTFKETRLRFFANFVSLVSVVAVCLGVLYLWKKKLLV